MYLYKQLYKIQVVVPRLSSHYIILHSTNTNQVFRSPAFGETWNSQKVTQLNHRLRVPTWAGYLRVHSARIGHQGDSLEPHESIFSYWRRGLKYNSLCIDTYFYCLILAPNVLVNELMLISRSDQKGWEPFFWWIIYLDIAGETECYEIQFRKLSMRRRWIGKQYYTFWNAPSNIL